MHPHQGPGEATWQRWIDGLRDGDESAVAEFCVRYAGALERLADRRLGQGLRRRVGPESIAQSACWSFLRRAREGQFELAGAENLWRLLCAMTLRKVREKVRFHQRERRELAREAGSATELAEHTGLSGAEEAQEPFEAVAIVDEFEALLASLDDERRAIVEAKLDERSNAEIAEQLGCSERTVRRLLSELRGQLEQALGAR